MRRGVRGELGDDRGGRIGQLTAIGKAPQIEPVDGKMPGETGAEAVALKR